MSCHLDPIWHATLDHWKWEWLRRFGGVQKKCNEVNCKKAEKITLKGQLCQFTIKAGKEPQTPP